MAESGGTMDDILTPQKPYGPGYDTTTAGVSNLKVFGAPLGGGGRGLSSFSRSYGAPAGGFEWRDLGGVGDPIRFSNELDVNWETPWGKKTEQPQQQQSFFTKLLARLQNIKDPEKRRSWFKRLMGNLLRMNPATGPAMGIYDLAKAIKQGGGQGILGALGQKGMQKIFGKNLDVARGIFGAASGQMTPGQALGGVAMGRGMKTGMNNLMKNIYKKYGMSGVKTAMPIMKTLMQGQGPGKG